MSWKSRAEFGRWLRTARVGDLPVISQDVLAQRLGVTQSKVSRWEQERPGTEPPDINVCLRLADIFNTEFEAVASMSGWWNEDIRQRLKAIVCS